MTRYKLQVTKTLTAEVELEAETLAQARERAQERVRASDAGEEHPLDWMRLGDVRVEEAG